MLLMGLDPSTAAELLKSAEPETLTEIAAELSCLDPTARIEAEEPIREFFGLLRGKKVPVEAEEFVKDMLETILGQERSQEVLERVNERVKARDPFREIRSADVAGIVGALEGESPHVVSMVLSELPPKKSAELLGLLDENTRVQAVRCMTGDQEVSLETKLRIAAVVQDRLKVKAAVGALDQQQQLRKVAVLLRGLDVGIREGLTQSLSEQDGETAEAIQKLMVIWEDVLQVAERPLQEALRSVDSRKLALALIEADEKTVAKIHGNIAERAKAMLEEEASLLSSPKANEIEEAREDILSALREMNSRGELQFEEG